jgi:tRNA (guanine37-N1)-methyltransferase
MKIDILSLFPDYFRGPFDVSILKRAQEKGLLEIAHTDIRGFATGKHRKVDDRPYGGGPGMVLKPKPVVEAIRSVRKEGAHVIYLTPQGEPLTPKLCQTLAEMGHLILLCGHYEGIDERIGKEIDQEISIGDYVLTNGCLPAIVLIDAVVRFIPGVLGHADGAAEDSFQNGLFEGPHYTRPEEFEGVGVPSVLKSGDHEKIRTWRMEQGFEKTKRVRPDLIPFMKIRF